MWWLRSVAALRGAGRRIYCQMHDPLDHVTGIEKRELLAHLAGDCDPFRAMAIKKGDVLCHPYCEQGPGTRERPNLIPSSQDMRLIACICNEHVMHAEYMWLHQNEPKRCGCGYWFELCPVAPL